MERKRARAGRLQVIWSMFNSPVYLAIAVSGSLFYFLIFYYLVTTSNYGVFLVLVPVYLVYIMVASAGILLALGVFSLSSALMKPVSGVEEGAFSAILPTVGGLVATCSCSYSVLAALLAFFGINAFEISGIVSGISLYQIWLIVAVVLLNIVMLYYYSGKVADAECRLTKKNPY